MKGSNANEKVTGPDARRIAAMVLLAAVSTETWHLFSAIVSLAGAKGKELRLGAEPQKMTIEIQYLAWVAILTLLIRVPWMINKVTVRGLARVTEYPLASEPLSGWAHRVWVAHEDAVQNLIVFAVLVGALHALGHSNAWTAGAAVLYFWARLTHVIVYAFGIPRVKTLAFLAAFAAQLVLAWQLILEM